MHFEERGGLLEVLRVDAQVYLTWDLATKKSCDTQLLENTGHGGSTADVLLHLG